MTTKREEKLRSKFIEMTRIENELFGAGFKYIGGVDEVGRGPLAGPVVAACVILPRDFAVLGVDDSKKLSEKRREELALLIKDSALAYGIGMEDEKVIDDINILNATKQAMKRAVEEASCMLADRIDYLLFDAMTIDEIDIPQRSIVKGDSKSVSIAAASIMAKVTRDHMMIEYDSIYPGYSFASNKGYGTKAHYEGIKELGICPIHRKTFLKNIEEK